MNEATYFPLSSAQRRTWFLDELRADDYGFSDYRVFRATGTLDLTALRLALARLVERHEPLRTTYVRGPDGDLAQRVAGPGGGELPLTVIAVADEESALSEARRRAAVRFCLGEGPLAAVAVLRVGPELCFVVLTFHLLVMDAWGLSVWCRDLSAYYAEAVGGPRAELPELPVQYADWAVWEREQLTPARRAELLDWWLPSLTGFPRLLGLPAEAPGAAALQGGAVGRRRYRAVPPGLARAVTGLARREGITPYTVFAAAHAVTLAVHSGQPRMLVAIPVANRELPEVQDLLGFFTGTVAVPVDLAGGPSFREAWRRVAAATAAAYAHRDLPFDQLVAALAEPGGDGRFPLAQAGFVHRPRGSAGVLSLRGGDVADQPLDIDRTRFEFTVRVDETAAGTVACAEFDATLFAPGFVERFLDDWVAVLTRMTADPSATALMPPLAESQPPAQSQPPAGRQPPAVVVGGDSLALLVELVRLRAESGRRVTLRELYQPG